MGQVLLQTLINIQKKKNCLNFKDMNNILIGRVKQLLSEDLLEIFRIWSKNLMII